MKKLILVTLLMAAAFGSAFAGGGKESSKPSNTNNSASQTAPAAQAKPVETPNPSNPYFDGDGGMSKGIAILAPTGEGLSKDEAYLPIAAQGNFVTNFTKFSAMPVLDRVSLEKVLTEAESGIYSGDADFARLGEITGKQYVMTGKVLKTQSGYSLQMQITDTKSAQTAASYTGNCTVAEIDNYAAIKKASEDLLTQMGVSLTDRGRQELLGINTQAGNAETALAKGITAQRNGTTVETLAYYYQAAAFDPSLAEAVSRASVLSADISSGNIGQNVRNDIAWRDAWLARLTETENFFREYIKTPPPYDLVYSTELKQGTVDYNNRTVSMSFGIELLSASIAWFDTMEKVANTVGAGLNATGRATTWGLSWPSKMVSQGATPFASQDKTLSFIAELVNEDGITIGRMNYALPYGWNITLRSGGIGATPKPNGSWNVTFQAVKADLITDKLTIKIISIDGVAAETAGKDGHIMIAANPEYDQSPHGIGVRDIVLYGFRNGTITRYGGTARAVVIPATINGIPVTAIGYRAFKDDKHLQHVTIPNSVTSIGGDAFGDELAIVTIPADVRLAGAFPNNSDFEATYNVNGKRAGTYERTGQYTQANTGIGLQTYNSSGGSANAIRIWSWAYTGNNPITPPQRPPYRDSGGGPML